VAVTEDVPDGSAVLLRSVVCVLDGLPVLAGLDLSVRPGEVVLVTGENGAGKSTLLRLVAGLLPLAAGRASVFGHDLGRRRPEARAAVALVGHASTCYDDLSVRANLRFHARALGRRAAEAEREIDRVGLASVADRAHGRLSAGQRKRCSLAVAMLRDARLLLLDEPFAALDVAGRRLVDDVVREALARGATVLLVSHEQEHARTLADRELVLRGGRLLDAGL
jgi:heme ABC exporter ATP-binding subunit CcmA